MNTTSPPSRPIIRRILHHLVQHPEAKDTCKGIMRWWVGAVERERRAEDVEQAINWLVAEGWLVKRDLRSSQTIYAMNQAKGGSIEELLKTL